MGEEAEAAGECSCLWGWQDVIPGQAQAPSEVAPDGVSCCVDADRLEVCFKRNQKV